MTIINKDYSDLSTLAPIVRKSDTFLSEWAGLLAEIQLQWLPGSNNTKVDIGETFRTLPRIRGIEPDVIKSFLKGCALTPFSKYGPIKSNTFNAAVPILLYAHKQMNGVPYSAWEGQKHSQKVLPQALQNIPIRNSLDTKPWDNWEHILTVITDHTELTSMSVEQARILSVTDSKGIQHNFSDYKCNPIGNLAWDSLNKIMRMMRLQLWIFNAAKRNKWMILNWCDWDNMPEPIDVVSNLGDTWDNWD